MAGHSADEQPAEGTATPEATRIFTLELELGDMDLAFGGIRTEVKAALLAYQEASDAQERLLGHMERIVKWATAQVPRV